MDDATVPRAAPRGSYLGWRAQRRPRPGFAHVLGAAAGAFVVIALVAFVAAIDDEDPTVAGTGLSLVLAVVVLAVGFRVPGPVRTACTTALVFTVPLLWLFALVGDGNGGRSDVRGILLLTLIGYGALYLLSWTRGRAVFLAGALVVFTIWIAFEIAGDASAPSFGFSPATDALGSDTIGFTGDTSARGAVMVVGIVFLVIGGLLDQRRLSGSATPFVAVGAVGAIGGGVTLAATESTLAAGAVAALIGAAVGIVAAAGPERRATTWLGVLTVFGGLAAILGDIAPDSNAGVGAIALGFAVALGAIAWLLAPALREPDDGDIDRDGDRDGDGDTPPLEPASPDVV